MAGRGVWSRKFLGALMLVFLLGCAIVAWRERSTLLSWFYLYNLTRAPQDQRERWVARVANLGEMAIPGLLDCLTQADARVCGNARAALEQMAHSWSSDYDPHSELIQRLARAFAHFSPAGQRQVLDLVAGWFSAPQGSGISSLVSPSSRLVGEAANTTDAEVQTSALELCAILLSRPDGNEAWRPGQDLIRAALHGSTVDNRLRAVRLTLHPGMVELLELVVVLLNDESPLVRRAALLTVGPARGVIHDDQLLPYLHDPDPEVRRLCEVALGGRGLRPEYLELGRLLTDPQPATRLRVLDCLRGSTELDPGLWLRRLSKDPSPSVRVAAVRAMTQQTFVDLSDRIDQMVRTDPSLTVRQLAQFYLTCPRPRAERTSDQP